MEPVATPLPLSTRLSQVLVAHTIELDNEAELQRNAKRPPVADVAVLIGAPLSP